MFEEYEEPAQNFDRFCDWDDEDIEALQIQTFQEDIARLEKQIAYVKAETDISEEGRSVAIARYVDRLDDAKEKLENVKNRYDFAVEVS